MPDEPNPNDTLVDGTVPQGPAPIRPRPRSHPSQTPLKPKRTTDRPPEASRTLETEVLSGSALAVTRLSVMRGARRVLRDIEFSARPGEVVAILGPNGAGKSTLLEAILGLLPSSGDVRTDGVDLLQLSAVERARRIAYVPQRSDLRAGLSVREVVALGRFAHGQGNTREDALAIEAALDSVDLRPFASRPYPALSVGEQQRVWIARALCTQAPVLLLDEPTAALDIRQSLATFATLRRLAHDGRALVVVLHSIEYARRFADRALVLDEGRVCGFGPAKDVLHAALVREVYGVTMRESHAPSFSLAEGDEVSR